MHSMLLVISLGLLIAMGFTCAALILFNAILYLVIECKKSIQEYKRNDKGEL